MEVAGGSATASTILHSPPRTCNQIRLPSLKQSVLWLTSDVATDELGAVSREPGGVVTGCAPPARVERRSPVRDAKQGEGAVVGGEIGRAHV